MLKFTQIFTPKQFSDKIYLPVHGGDIIQVAMSTFLRMNHIQGCQLRLCYPRPFMRIFIGQPLLARVSELGTITTTLLGRSQSLSPFRYPRSLSKRVTTIKNKQLLYGNPNESTLTYFLKTSHQSTQLQQRTTSYNVMNKEDRNSAAYLYET